MISYFKILGSVIEKEIDAIVSRLGTDIYDVVLQIILEEAQRNQDEWFSDRVPNLNYESPECRLAYLYIVAAANASTFEHVLESDKDLNEFILKLAKERHAIRICAFGAGPGTELLAVARFLARQNLEEKGINVDFQLLDKVQEWTNSWYGIRDGIMDFYQKLYGMKRADWPMIPAGNFLFCDVTQPEKIHNLSNVWGQNDIYVINFLLSEVFHDDPGLKEFLREVSTYANPESRFVFIERRGSMWEKRMINIAKEAGLHLLPFQESRGKLEEEPTAMGTVYEILEDKRKPRLNWNVVYSIGIKQ